MCTLSFIVPAYNAEEDITQCINSLYKQDFPIDDYEVIVVDDCSTDNTINVLKELLPSTPTLHILQTPSNIKQGGARNKGVRHVKGEYLWFVDSDDCISPNCLRQLLCVATTNNLDILTFGHQNSRQDTTVNYNSETTSGTDYIFDGKGKWDHKCSTIWNSIIRKDFLLENNILFRENVQFEDTDYGIQLYASAKRVKRLAAAPYIYNNKKGSTTHNGIKPHHAIDYYAFLQSIATLSQRYKHQMYWNTALQQYLVFCYRSLLKLIDHLNIDDLQQYFVTAQRQKTIYSYFLPDLSVKYSFAYRHFRKLTDFVLRYKEKQIRKEKNHD